MYTVLLVVSLLVHGYGLDLGDQCFSDDACLTSNSTCLKQPESTCNYGTCSCVDGYYNNGRNDCWRKQIRGESCSEHVCLLEDGLTCTSNTRKCECLDLYENDGEKCKAVSKNLTQSCTTDENCKQLNSECKQSNCGCKAGFYENDGACKPALAIDAACKIDQCDTTKYLKCSNQNCTCFNEYRRKNDICEPAIVDDECDSESLTCNTNNMECTNSKCKCKTNFKWEDSNIAGVFKKRCVHKNATLNVPEKDVCLESLDSTARLCAKDLLCQKCLPKSTSICLGAYQATTSSRPVTVQNSGESSFANTLLVTLSIFSSILMVFGI